ncbi:unnamed protein product [Oikopleura dioica]|uniref:Uncharacterized protein n=1 Tax=Oikopleura dioica TaxID=34765 RepID=E4WQE3_OIKDI|nr:unnamed protein product [Oikopleura dioica]
MQKFLFLIFIAALKAEKRCGEDIKEISKGGMSSLHRAVHPLIRPDLECVKHLLQRGADVNLQTSQGSTSLHLLFKGASDLKLTAAVLDLFLEKSADLEIKDENGREAVHYLYENVKISDEFKAEVVKKLVSEGNHVSEEMPWLGIKLPFLEKKLELLPGPPIPAAVKAVFEAENERFDRIKIAHCLAENEKQAAKINELSVNNTELEKQAQNLNRATEKIAELEVELGRFREVVLQSETKLDKKEENIEALSEKNKQQEAQLEKHLEEEMRLMRKIEELEKEREVMEKKEAQLLEKAHAKEEALEASANQFKAMLRADFEQESAKFEESLQNEKALVGLLSGELDAAKMQLASAKNQTCSSKNVTTDVSSCLNDLDLDEEIERLTSEKRQIVAFILQFLAVYVFWKLGRKFFKKAEDPEHSEIPSELSRYIEKLEKTLEYNRGLQRVMNLSLDRKSETIKSLETSLRDQSAILFPSETDADETTEDPSSLVR